MTSNCPPLLMTRYEIFTEREGTRLPHLVHVSAAFRRRKCFQCQHVGHVAVPGVRQGLRDNLRPTVIGRRSGTRLRISDLGKTNFNLTKLKILSKDKFT